MSNPMFSDKKLEEARSGWAQPTPPSNQWAPPAAQGAGGPPAGTLPQRGLDDGPISPWTGAMTVAGTISATAVLFVLLLSSAVVGWMSTDQAPDDGSIRLPAFALVGVAVGFGAVIACYFRPQWAKVIGPVYALAMGFTVGAFSKAFELQYSGIVLQAIGGTVATFLSMLVLYRTGIIKVTGRFRRIVVGATAGVFVLYLVSFLFAAFGGGLSAVSFLHDATPLGIAFSIFVCGLAAFNLALDFDFIERGTREGLAKQYEWFAAFGLMVTIVWLYIEILRLLAKLRE